MGAAAFHVYTLALLQGALHLLIPCRVGYVIKTAQVGCNLLSFQVLFGPLNHESTNI